MTDTSAKHGLDLDAMNNFRKSQFQLWHSEGVSVFGIFSSFFISFFFFGYNEDFNNSLSLTLPCPNHAELPTFFLKKPFHAVCLLHDARARAHTHTVVDYFYSKLYTQKRYMMKNKKERTTR